MEMVRYNYNNFLILYKSNHQHDIVHKDQKGIKDNNY